MASYPFLSDEWLDQARKIRAEYEGKTPPIPHVVRMNLVVTGVPFSEGDILAHMDTSNGELVLDTGHLENQDLKVDGRLRHGQGDPDRGEPPGRHAGLHGRQGAASRATWPS